MISTISLTKLSEIPYLDVNNLQGRYISSLTFHDNGEWHTWLPIEDGLIKVKAWPAEAFYFSKSPESPHDICFHFQDFIAQRASFSSIKKPITGLQDDICNLSASLAKIIHLHKTREIIGVGISRMIATEVEFIFSTCRSIFDLLQEISQSLWNTIQLHDGTLVKRPLKETFSRMITLEGKVAEPNELANRFGLPQPLALFYKRNANFFLALREFRDNIIHHGSQVQTIFTGDHDFLIKSTSKPFSKFNIWTKEELLENDLAPLCPALAYVIHHTLGACEDFSSTMEKLIIFPPPIAPGMNFFMRGYFNEPLISMLQDINTRLENKEN